MRCEQCGKESKLLNKHPVYYEGQFIHHVYLCNSCYAVFTSLGLVEDFFSKEELAEFDTINEVD